jgi:hypothetical protein
MLLKTQVFSMQTSNSFPGLVSSTCSTTL